MANKDKKILLMGNPNVGKSAIFSRLTGAKVTVSNYPGTTVGFTQGKMKLGEDTSAVIIDVPGIYDLTPRSKADEVAVEMVAQGDVVINVLDATNLERNLYLTLELKEKGVPMIVVLNMWDETRHNGIEIDVEALEDELKLPVVYTCGLTGSGIKHLVEKINNVSSRDAEITSRDEKWEEIGRIVEACQILHHHHHTLMERIEDITTHRIFGLPFAALVLYVSFIIIRFIGEGLIGYVFDPLFNRIWLPVVMKIGNLLGGDGLLYDIVIGKLIDGQVDFFASFGLLTTGIYVPIAAVLPYMISFYIVLGIMEDIGYLPRLATQVDNIMHRIGLHGYAIVPMILGLGCNVPGAMAVRLLENRREKFIAATLMAVCVPCMAQIAMIVGLVGQRGGEYVLLIFATLFVLLVTKGLIMNRVMKGNSPEILWEIPPYRRPQPLAVIKKLWMRVRGFLTEAVPFVLAGVIVVNFLYMSGMVDKLADLFAPLLTGLWGLPKETISAMLIGFLRKDVAIGMLAPLDLTNKQLVIASTILAIYFPCVATFIVMVRELGAKDMFKSACLMIVTAVTVGAAMNFLFRF